VTGVVAGVVAGVAASVVAGVVGGLVAGGPARGGSGAVARAAESERVALVAPPLPPHAPMDSATAAPPASTQARLIPVCTRQVFVTEQTGPSTRREETLSAW
jgi:hypothetical protein